MNLNSQKMEHSNVLDAAKHLLLEMRFKETLRTSAQQLLHLHLIAPRTVRYVANIPKWLLTQSIVLLHFERCLDDRRPPLTVANLQSLLRERQVKAVSKNTAVAHLSEMRTYGLLEDSQSASDRRKRPLVLSDRGTELIRTWFEAHLTSLDLLDGGSRLALLKNQPSLLYRAHPAAIRMLVGHPAWNDPPCSVATFVWTESGSNILHDLLLRVPDDHPSTDRIQVGRVRATDITGRYIISRSHAQRLIARARDLNLLGWEKPHNSGSMWISRQLVQDYRAWQAVKFAAIRIAWDDISGAEGKVDRSLHG